MRSAAFCLVLWVGLVAPAALGAPTIHVDSATYATTVQPGTEVLHTFRLSNAGDATLSIQNVIASCGCTATTLEKRDLGPGESVDLEARVNTTGFSGTVLKTVTVQSNDPVTPSLVLQMTLTLADASQAPASAPIPAPAAAPQALPTPATSAATPAEPTSSAWPVGTVIGAALGAVALVGIVYGLIRQSRCRKPTTP